MNRSYASELLDDAELRWPDHEALVHGTQRWTYGRLAHTTRAFTRALSGLVRQGEDIAVLSGNRPELVALQLAAHLVGCRYVAASPAISPAALDRSLRDIAPAVLVFDAPSCTDRAEELRPLARPRHVLSLGPAAFGTDLLAAPPGENPPGEDRHSPGEAAPGESVRTVFLTGGTTGHPKPVEHRHRLYTFLRSLIGPQGLCLPGERRLVCTSLTYIGSHFILPTLMSGGTLVLHNGFDPVAAVATLQTERIHAVLLPTVMLDQLLDEPTLADAHLPDLRRIQYGASRCSPHRLRQAMDRFGPVLQQVYGLTEAGVVSLLQPGDHSPAHPRLLASAGRPVPGVRVEIRDEQGTPVPVGEPGEVCVRGPGVMERYLFTEPGAQPVAEGWLRTGDLGRIDDSGHLFIVDRLKDVILEARTGLRIWSGEVEEALLRHPAVRDAAVFGVPADGNGEWVHAAVTPAAPAAMPDENELRRHVLTELRHEPAVPERIHVLDALPLTAVGKVDKKALRNAFPGTTGTTTEADA